MRIARIARAGYMGYALLEDGHALPVRGTPFDFMVKTGERWPLSECVLLAPCVPSKVVAIGVNYREHAAEMNERLPVDPIIFLKPPTAVVGPERTISRPKISQRIDYEAELAVVIGKTCFMADAEHAMEYVLGFTCLNDVTARDLQKRDGQWTRGKGFDTFCPIGPWIQTELDWQNAPICLRLNGQMMQQSNTSMQINRIPEMIAYISAVMTLNPGDVIATGTPQGVGPMQPGDVVEVEIGGIGVLRNIMG